MRFLGYLIALIIAVLGISFAFLNTAPVTLHFFVINPQLPLALLLTIVFGIGGILGLLVSCLSVLRAKKTNFTLKHQIRLLEKELQKSKSSVVPQD